MDAQGGCFDKAVASPGPVKENASGVWQASRCNYFPQSFGGGAVLGAPAAVAALSQLVASPSPSQVIPMVAFSKQPRAGRAAYSANQFFNGFEEHAVKVSTVRSIYRTTIF